MVLWSGVLSPPLRPGTRRWPPACPGPGVVQFPSVCRSAPRLLRALGGRVCLRPPPCCPG
eukprot:284353-Pyramimonas_sp.AAC.1